MGKMENEDIPVRYSSFFYFSFIVEAFNKFNHSLFKGYIDMSLLKLKLLRQSCCLIIFIFLLLLPVSAFSEYALQFNGDSRVDLGSSSWFPQGMGFTIEASIMPISFDGPAYIMSNGGWWNGANLVSLVVESDKISLYSKAYYVEGVSYSASYTLPTNAFSYIAVTYEPSMQVAHIFVNGVDLPITQSIISMPFPYFSTIGNLSEWSEQGYGFNGYIDGLVVTGYPKDSTTISNTNKTGLTCTSSVGCWLFEEASGNIAVDSSGNGRDGSIVNGIFSSASAPGGSASGSFGPGGSGFTPPAGASVAFSPVGSASGVASGVGAIAVGAGSLLGILAAYSAVKSALNG